MAKLPSQNTGEWQKGNEGDLSTIQDCFCPNCGGNHGVTTLLPTKIPFFREIVIVSFYCHDCAFRNAEVTSGGEIQAKGQKLTLTLTSSRDLNRQLIKSESASVLIPYLDFEIPPGTQRGSITTVEGIIRTAAEKLQAVQPERLRLGDVDNFHRCHVVIEALRRIVGIDASDPDDDDNHEEHVRIFPFDIVLDDPAGNSFIENLHAPSRDPQLTLETYFRSPTQDMALGLQPSRQAFQEETVDKDHPQQSEQNPSCQPGDGTTADTMIGRDEVLKFPTTCLSCHKPAETSMCVTNHIPHFKEVIIMSLFCEHCGYKSSEIKGGGAIPSHGSRITLQCNSLDDLQREVLKSDTAGIEIPQLDLQMEQGGLDGVYTTVEGLLDKLHSRLVRANPFGLGDAAHKHHRVNDGDAFSGLSPNHVRYAEFMEKLQRIKDGNLLPFTIILTDPLANSFVGSIPRNVHALSLQAEREGSRQCFEDYVDPGMAIEAYARTFEENEGLGLNDMKTENYATSTDTLLPRQTNTMGPTNP